MSPQHAVIIGAIIGAIIGRHESQGTSAADTSRKARSEWQDGGSPWFIVAGESDGQRVQLSGQGMNVVLLLCRSRKDCAAAFNGEPNLRVIP